MDALLNGYQAMLQTCRMTSKATGQAKDKAMVSVDDLTLRVQMNNLVSSFFRSSSSLNLETNRQGRRRRRQPRYKRRNSSCR